LFPSFIISGSTAKIFPGTLQPGDYFVAIDLEPGRGVIGCDDEVEYEVLADYSDSPLPTPSFCGDAVFEDEQCVTSPASDLNAGCYAAAGGVAFNPKTINIGDERSCGQLSSYPSDVVNVLTGDLDAYQFTVETAGLYSFILESDDLFSGPEDLRIAPYVFGPDPECVEADPITGLKITNYIPPEQIVGGPFFDDTTLAFVGNLDPGRYQILITAADGDFTKVPECDSDAGLGYFLRIKAGDDIPTPPAPTPPPAGDTRSCSEKYCSGVPVAFTFFCLPCNADPECELITLPNPNCGGFICFGSPTLLSCVNR